uniref:Homeodomain interacting protein kinase 4 n=1 Tax=Falco tinnunculus TaxID=100819 RepID=A0A8C4XNC8_FALTI
MELDFGEPGMVTMVGKGTFGAVAHAWQRSTGEMVAIKMVKNEGHHGQVVKNELRLLQALQEVDSEKSHIVRFLESFSDGACTYLLFESLEQNLFEFQKQNNFLPLPVRHIRTITAQVLAALVKLRELSIIHTDIKPENIMLVDHASYPFHVKLIDFGSASILNEVRHIKAPYIQSRFYRSPEILLGLPFCEKVDMWSLGCVVAELHLGWPLFPGINEYDQVRYICSTLGLPDHELLCAAQKTQQEMLAKRCDLHGMVELVKRMLTWDSHKRIEPSAALKHPFISLQLVKSKFEATQYYKLCQEDLRASHKDTSTAKIFPGMEKGAFIPRDRRGITQMDGLSLAEPAGDRALLSHRSNPGKHPGSQELTEDLPLPHFQLPQPGKASSMPVEENVVREVLGWVVPDVTGTSSCHDPPINSLLTTENFI